LKRKRNWPARIAFLAALVITVSLVTLGCVSGLTAIGWSGGIVSNGFLYIGTQEGKLASINLSDDSRLSSEALVPVSQPGLFGCSASSGCGGGSARVPIYGTPALAGELVYIAGYNGRIYAYNADNLAVRWVFPREGYLSPIVGGIVTDGDRLYFGGSDGWVYALDAVTGDKLWTFKTDAKIWGTPAVLQQTALNMSSNETRSENTVFIGSFDKKIYALNALDGSKKWEFATEGSIIATPLVFNNTVYIGSCDRNLYALKAHDGSLIWKISGKNFFWAQPAVVDGTIYAGCLDGHVYVLDASSGAQKNDYDLKSQIASTPVAVNDFVVVASRKGVIYSINTQTGELKQLVDLKKDVNGPLTANGDIVYIHTQDGVLQRINVVSGAILTAISLHS
jgi:outer membrane protein assembly factor BamB